MIISLISSTTTTQGLKIYAQLDEGDYPKAVKVTDEQLAQVQLTRHAFHGDRNYMVNPTPTKS